jgi:hypothetical protein
VAFAEYAGGFIVFGINDKLMARRFDPDKLRFTADSVALGPRAGIFAVSRSGVLAYFAPGEPAKSEMRWIGRAGQQIGIVGKQAWYDNPELSPDGSRVAYQAFTPGESTVGSIWIFDPARDVSTRVTFDSAVTDDRPVWSPDGKYLLFYRYEDKTMRKVLASGLGGNEVVLANAYPDDWSGDGRYIAYDDTSTGTPQVGILQLAPEKKSSLLLNIKASNHDAHFSPDTKYVAYTSDESGQDEVYVVPFPTPTQKWRVSTSGGTRALWRHDGKELFYLAPDGKLMSTSISGSGDALTFAKPAPLFQAPFQTSGPSNVGRPFDVAPDGQKFLVNAVVETTPQPMTLVTNWTALAKK